MKKLIFFLISIVLFSNCSYSMEARKAELKDLPIELREIIVKFSPDAVGNLEEVVASIASLAKTNKEFRDLVYNNFEHIYESLERQFPNKSLLDIFDSLAYRLDPEEIVNFLEHFKDSIKISNKNFPDFFEYMINVGCPNVALAMLLVKGNQIGKDTKRAAFDLFLKHFASKSKKKVKDYLIQHGWTEKQLYIIKL